MIGSTALPKLLPPKSIGCPMLLPAVTAWGTRAVALRDRVQPQRANEV
jgi:hypothetical protein